MPYYTVYQAGDGYILSPRVQAGATLYPVPPEGGAYVGVQPTSVQLAYPSVLVAQAPPPVTYIVPSPRQESKVVMKGAEGNQVIFKDSGNTARLYVPVRQQPVVKHKTVLKNSKEDRHKVYLSEKVKYVYDHWYPYSGWYMNAWR